MLKKKNQNLIVGFILMGIVLAMALLSLFWTPYDPNGMNVELKNSAPTLNHIFGCDNFGRDTFSRVMVGAGNTFVVAILTVLIGVFFGSIVGLIAGYIGGWFDEIIMRLSDTLTAFPSILLALIFVAIFGSGKYTLIVALGILFIPSFARIVRSEMVRLKSGNFVKSAKLMGASNIRIIFMHILPNALASILAAVAVGFNNAVLAEASMSYLGLGVQPPEASLGRMLSEAQSYLFTNPWFAIFPGIIIVVIVLGFSLISEGVGETNA